MTSRAERVAAVLMGGLTLNERRIFCRALYWRWFFEQSVVIDDGSDRVSPRMRKPDIGDMVRDEISEIVTLDVSEDQIKELVQECEDYVTDST